MSERIFIKSPSILSFQRCMVINDALFFNKTIDGELSPILVINHGIRCTQNTNKRGKNETSTTKTAKLDDVRNLQEIDSAKTASDTDTFLINFNIKFIDLKQSLFAVAGDGSDDKSDIKSFTESIHSFLSKIDNSVGLFDVSCRLARNIANARWAWRNRVYASTITTTVTCGDQEFIFNSLDIPLSHFDDYTDDEKSLGMIINTSLSGGEAPTIHISGDFDFGVRGVFEVFPSQCFVPNVKGRKLYCAKIPDNDDEDIKGQAAFRDQKLSNAIKTIDTWYLTYNEVNEPISVEPEGTSLKFNEFMRSKTTTSFDMIKRLNTIHVDSDEGKFMIACFLRGGVYPGK